jgi:hypothetical protein
MLRRLPGINRVVRQSVPILNARSNGESAWFQQIPFVGRVSMLTGDASWFENFPTRSSLNYTMGKWWFSLSHSADDNRIIGAPE